MFAVPVANAHAISMEIKQLIENGMKAVLSILFFVRKHLWYWARMAA